MNKQTIIRVRDVMKPNVDVVDGLVTVADALRHMQFPETGTLIVDKRHENDEYGMVLFSDLAQQFLAKDRSPERVNVYEIMTKPVIHVGPDMDIRFCARLFTQYGLSRVPVLDNGDLLGLVSNSDIVSGGLMNRPGDRSS